MISPCVPKASIPPVKRSTKSVSRPKWLGDYVTGAIKIAPCIDHSQSHYAIANYVDYSKRSSKYQVFIYVLDQEQDLQTFSQAVIDAEWYTTMSIELQALERNRTWEVTTLPPDKRAIGCK